MKNITEIEVKSFTGELFKHIIIENEDGSFTSMPKEIWDEQQAAKE